MHACTHTHTHAHAHTHTRTHTLARTGPPTDRRHHPGCRCYMGGVRPTMTKICPLFACSAGHEWPVGASLKNQSRVRGGIRDRFGCFSRIHEKMLGRTETPTRQRMYCQSIRIVRDISRDDRARIATCILPTPTYRQTDLRRIIV